MGNEGAFLGFWKFVGVFVVHTGILIFLRKRGERFAALRFHFVALTALLIGNVIFAILFVTVLHFFIPLIWVAEYVAYVVASLKWKLRNDDEDLDELRQINRF